ncbi:four helix bundle protein [Ekhidna sp. To15]|uniref:four helix bundle protein n=1 Tax=Ekhidna sp. To15 TaxID=3395267 RepID=UPI003F526AEF
MHRYNELEVLKKALNLSLEVYGFTQGFPSEEKFGLISQMRRSSVSIAPNIAEGAEKNTNGEFEQFLGFAQGSAYELETQLIIARNMDFISKEDSEKTEIEIPSISNMIFKLKQSLKS